MRSEVLAWCAANGERLAVPRDAKVARLAEAARQAEALMLGKALARMVAAFDGVTLLPGPDAGYSGGSLTQRRAVQAALRALATVWPTAPSSPVPLAPIPDPATFVPHRVLVRLSKPVSARVVRQVTTRAAKAFAKGFITGATGEIAKRFRSRP